jgi:hypothetical protein
MMDLKRKAGLMASACDVDGGCPTPLTARQAHDDMDVATAECRAARHSPFERAGAPPGHETYPILTVRGQGRFACLRIYGPEPAAFEPLPPYRHLRGEHVDIIA